MNIKILGSGCKNCEVLLKSAKEAVIDGEIEYITDMEKQEIWRDEYSSTHG